MGYTPIRSRADVEAKLIIGVTLEDHWLEFKSEAWRPGDSKECARDVVQFANASGGTLVIGAEGQNEILRRFRAVENANAVGPWVDTVLNGCTEPVPAFEPQVITVEGGVTLVAINVPLAPSLIAVRRAEGFEFPLRAGTAKRYLKLQEVVARMVGRERLHRLRIEQIGRNVPVGLDATIDRDLDHNNWRVVDVDDDVVRLRQGGAEVAVPLVDVEAVYNAGVPDAEWILRLSCFLSRHRQRGTIIVTKEMPFGRNEGHYRRRSLGRAD